jgi:hypothetical protein
VISIGALATVKDANIQANANAISPKSLPTSTVLRGQSVVGRAPSRVVLGTHLHTRLAEKNFVVAFTGADGRTAAALGCAISLRISTIRSRAEGAGFNRTQVANTRMERASTGAARGQDRWTPNFDRQRGPIRTHSSEFVADGLLLGLPKGVPWRPQGKASLSFDGLATFIGEAHADTRGTHFTVERMLPDLPLVLDPREIWTRSDSIRPSRVTRLEQELARRGLPVPTIPLQPPTPTRGLLARAELMQQGRTGWCLYETATAMRRNVSHIRLERRDEIPASDISRHR